MITNRRLRNMLAVIGLAIMLMAPLTVTAADKNLAAGETWSVDKTTILTGLTIGEGASIAAPEGYALTMTVDGAAKAIKAGKFEGKIMITVIKG